VNLITTAILIRHGERDQPTQVDPDPHLNEAGKVRAQTLVHLVGKTGIKAIYTSHFARAKETAQPLALQLHLSPVTMDDAAEVKTDIFSRHAGQTVLVVGHTDTIPELIKLLGGNGSFAIDDSEFDKLFIASIAGAAGTHITELRFGNPT
jgi:broad specificity phosphatase PhoE